MNSSPTMAVLDMGTNTFLLIIGKIEDGKIDKLYSERQFVYLGKEGISKGKITESAADRAMEALKRFNNIMSFYHVEKHIAIATSAMRSASNGNKLLKRIKQEMSIVPVIIDGDLEAQLIYEGVSASTELEAGATLVMDIGGGSVEFIIGEGDKVHWKQSFEIGGQRLADLFMKEDPIGPKSIKELNAYLDQELKPLKQALGQYAIHHFVGASGSFDTLWKIHTKVKAEAEEAVTNPWHFSYKDFQVLHKKLTTFKKAARLSIPGMVEERVNMLVVASCLVEYVFRMTGMQELHVSQGALREGALLRLMQGKPIDK